MSFKLVESIMTKNPCYMYEGNITVKGLMLHSVGCPQPSAKAFINAWNNPNYGSACVHGFIDANDGTVYQTLPWNHKGWHSASGWKGAAHDTMIGVEMCEPACITYVGGATFTCSDLATARAAVKRTYESAVQLYAYLCNMFNLDPLKDGVVISHAEGYARGIASGHADPEHLWNQLGTGYTMDGFRKDVKAAMGTSTPNGTTTTTSTTSKFTPIMGTQVATASQMQAYVKSVNPKVAQSVIDMIPLYLSEGKIEGVRGDIAFAQSCLETGNFGFTGGTAVTLDQNNFCGMGVTSKGLKGNSFDTPQLGIRAQIQHLKAYGSTDALKQECIDPRFKYVTRKSAEYWEWLGIPDNPNGCGWAGGEGYGAKILEIYNKIVGIKTADTTVQVTTTTQTTTSQLYRIRKSWADASSQIGAYSKLENAIAQWKSGYFVYDWNGKQVYPEVKTKATLVGVQSLNLPKVEKGCTGSAVNAIQAILGTTVNGKFNDKDVESLKAFQKNVGLAQDGVCGKETWAKLINHIQANTFA